MANGPKHLEALGELNGLFPSVGTKIVQFQDKKDFNALNLTDKEWESVMPRGGGFVFGPDDTNSDSSYDLPRPIRSKGKDVYNIAIFHQLHCLHALAEEFKGLITTIEAGRPGDGVGSDRIEHIQHCLAYLKESLVCCGDTAYEGQSSITDLPSTSGFGSYHVCRNFQQIFTLSEDRRVTNMAGYGQGGHSHGS
ncbi:hypothetical protein N0V93_005984 [Gnomoniopsis smithogilvyi]|uniref:Uncharacterized protein n=1 Tax=Gnomoniopsis smithogilvyi TaxID=1191159 RepID=A0A9W8YPX4_9PEZI|nr:hypothetical protein N0V93_005984 [Gnomoniopsis smithogilvyi]